jgi:hypothetical protein
MQMQSLAGHKRKIDSETCDQNVQNMRLFSMMYGLDEVKHAQDNNHDNNYQFRNCFDYESSVPLGSCNSSSEHDTQSGDIWSHATSDPTSSKLRKTLTYAFPKSARPGATSNIDREVEPRDLNLCEIVRNQVDSDGNRADTAGMYARAVNKSKCSVLSTNPG